ncbi:hypothetical protein [Mucilaginibacter agri]|uniref:Uncharacterized protein n=1 Tax=Mucilaginibacter agri TaxID=2695265 RepID=A0A965ZH63_9SPHI|nr:hypothetical protein [Mucilaginibacter agri]NCD69591.1 hypothetical protein [Mucilaginibacter agri]
MKTINNTDLLLRSIDIQLKKMLQADLKAYRTAQHKNGNNQGAKKAA